MKQILVIATGGTIACRSTEKGLMPQIEMEDFLNYVPKIREMCCLHAVQLMNLDSTNMQPENWIAIADTIHKEYDRYDGFVVLHGTDTMASTSALDPEMTREVLNILESLAEEGVCMLCVTHEMTFAKDVASRIIFMEGGKMVCDASKEEFFGSIRKDNERINKFLSFIGE